MAALAAGAAAVIVDVAGMDAVPVTLDGRPKLLARPLAEAALVALEPGLELVAAHHARDLVMEAG